MEMYLTVTLAATPQQTEEWKVRRGPRPTHVCGPSSDLAEWLRHVVIQCVTPTSPNQHQAPSKTSATRTNTWPHYPYDGVSGM